MATASAQQIFDWDKSSVWHHITQHSLFENQNPMVMSHGEGVRVWDLNGNQYLDATSGGVWCVGIGYGRESVANAVRDQLLKLNYFASTVGTPVAAEYAAKLLEKMPGMGRVYYSNSGSEANEKAYKMVRQIAHKKYGGKKNKILFRERDYHGTTITCLSSTGQQERRHQYGPFTPGFVEFPHCLEYRSQYGQVDNYGELAAKAFEDVVLREGPETVGAVVIEPMTAGGGIIIPPEGYLPAIQKICRKYDILLHLDEIVTGMGRTGKWFGYQHFDIQPDIVTMAKGVASGYAAISCTITTEAVFNLFKDDASNTEAPFRDISTFGGCTSGPVAALETLKIIEEENLIEKAAHMGDYIMTRLHFLKEKFDIIGDVRGKGLFIGLELVEDPISRKPVTESFAANVVTQCMKKGLLISRTFRSLGDYNNTLSLFPPFIITEEEADEMLDILESVFSAL